MSRIHSKKRLSVSPQLRIRKSSGELERFSPAKLQRSLIRCGTPTGDARSITNVLKAAVVPEMSTDAIRRLAHQNLRSIYPAAATRYDLSRAVMKLGPTGFPFEKLVARLYESEGYRVLVNQTRHGRCVDHEIDVVATKDGKTTFIECKFHNIPGTICDLKTSLYVKARSDDLQNSADPAAHHDFFGLVTNTRFSSEAAAFGNCVGLVLLGWTEPEGKSLASRLEASGLIPLTALTSIPRRVADLMMRQGVVTVRDLVDRPQAWRMLGRDSRRLEQIQSEIDLLVR